MELLGRFWELLAMGGGSLAITLIVALAIGFNVMATLYVGSAVVVLERFARVATARGWIVAAVLVTVLLATGLDSALRAPELATGSALWRADWLARLPWVALVCAGATAACALALRFVSGRVLGLAVTIGLGLAAALMLGALARPAFALVPFGVVAAIALWLRLRRMRAGAPAAASALEGGALVLSAVLALGPVLGFGLSAPAPALYGLGSRIASAVLGVVALGLLPLAAAGVLSLRGSVEWFVAVRYLFARRRQVFISAITGICVAGVAAGVWLLIVVLSVMNGFERTWREEILGNRAHLTVQHRDGPFGGYPEVLEEIRALPLVEGASPYLDADAMVRGEAGEIFTVRVRGIDPALVSSVTDLREDLVSGSIDALSNPLPGAEGGYPPIVIGSQLARATGVRVGDTLLFISPFGGKPTPLGPSPRLKRFELAGVFQSSFFQYDEVYTYVSIPAAQEFRRAADVVDGIEVRTVDHYRSVATGEAIVALLGADFTTRDWKEFFPEFFQALKTERIMMFLLLTMIMVVAAFVIVATLIMMIMEKTGDIAILKAMGARDESIERIFALEGTLIGIVGTGLGVLAGLAVTRQVSWIQNAIERAMGVDSLPTSVYQLSSLPTEVDPVQIAGVAAIAMVLSLGATLLPSRHGAALDPAQGLRDE